MDYDAMPIICFIIQIQKSKSINVLTNCIRQVDVELLVSRVNSINSSHENKSQNIQSAN